MKLHVFVKKGRTAGSNRVSWHKHSCRPLAKVVDGESGGGVFWGVYTFRSLHSQGITSSSLRFETSCGFTFDHNRRRKSFCLDLICTFFLLTLGLRARSKNSKPEGITHLIFSSGFPLNFYSRVSV